MQVVDQIMDLIFDPEIKKFTLVPEDNVRRIREIVNSEGLNQTVATNGRSIILELCPRGQRELAKEISNSVPKLTLEEAAAVGLSVMVREILDDDSLHVNKKSSLEGLAPLHLAAGFSGSLETVKTLVEYGADVNQFSTGGRIDELPPIVAAALGGNYEILNFLLDKGVDPNSQETNTKTSALHIISVRGDLKQAELLLSYGADPNLKGTSDRTPIDNAKKNNHVELLELFGSTS